MYMTVVCYIEIVPAEKYNNNMLKFIYNPVQVTVRSEKISGPYTTFDYIMWVILPITVGVIVLICTLRYCVRRIYMGSTELVEEKNEIHVSAAVAQTETGAMTGNVISGPLSDITIRETGLMSKHERTVN
jgi:hypothetical protein